jgi:hypothetical protein
VKGSFIKKFPAVVAPMPLPCFCAMREDVRSPPERSTCTAMPRYFASNGLADLSDVMSHSFSAPNVSPRSCCRSHGAESLDP